MSAVNWEKKKERNSLLVFEWLMMMVGICANACWWQVVCEVDPLINKQEWCQRCNVPSTYYVYNNWINFTPIGLDQGERERKITITTTTTLKHQTQQQVNVILLLLSYKTNTETVCFYLFISFFIKGFCLFLLLQVW